MSDAATRSADACYRHPDRASWILCQRCGRTICPQCQIQAPVGVHCPDCVAEARRSSPAVRKASFADSRLGRLLHPGPNAPVVTWVIAALCVLIYLTQIIPGSPVTAWLAYWPPLTAIEPWRMLTAAFVHSPTWPLHILFNLWALLLVGPMLEHLLGRWRFLAMYLLAAFGGSVAVLLLAPSALVVGASGAIFGLFGAYFVLQRGLGANPTGLLIVIGLNLAIGFLPGTNIAWQAHVGGLVAGAAVAFVYLRTRRRDQRSAQLAGLVAIALLLIALTVLRVFTLQ